MPICDIYSSELNNSENEYELIKNDTDKSTIIRKFELLKIDSNAQNTIHNLCANYLIYKLSHRLDLNVINKNNVISYDVQLSGPETLKIYMTDLLRFRQCTAFVCIFILNTTYRFLFCIYDRVFHRATNFGTNCNFDNNSVIKNINKAVNELQTMVRYENVKNNTNLYTDLLNITFDEKMCIFNKSI